MIDVWRGTLRVRKWPKKRGPPTSPVTRAQNKWFKDVARLSKACDPGQMLIAIETAKLAGLLPRDILISAMAGNVCDIELQDGVVRTKRPNRIYRTMWQGFVLNLNAPQGFPTGSYYDPIWPLPIRDTAGFWNAGTPTLITVPNGVTQMEFFGGWYSTAFLNGRSICRINKFGGPDITLGDVRGSHIPSHSVSSGPIDVTGGDQFRLRIYQTVAYQMVNIPATHFSGTILGTS